MLSILALLSVSAIARPAWATSPPGITPPFNECPAVGYDSTTNGATYNGCGFLIDISSTGTVTVIASGNGPYDGIDDTLVGVYDQCASCGTVTAISVSGAPGNDIVGFDGDGACSGINSLTPFPAPYPTLAQCGAGNYQTTTNPNDYQSVCASFTNINTATFNSATVVFSPGLTNGGTCWFSLEGALSSTSFTATTTSVSATGVPQFGIGSLSTIFIAAAGFAGIALLTRLRKSSVAIPRV